MNKILSIALTVTLVLTLIMSTTSLAAAEPQVLENGTFENGVTTGWSSENSAISATTATAHNGEYSLMIYNRTSNWGMAKLDVTSILNNRGPGTYYFSAYAKTATIADYAMIRLVIVTSNNDVLWFFINHQAAINSSNWADIGANGTDNYYFASEDGTVSTISWTGTVVSATVLINTVNGNGNFYLDDVAFWTDTEQEELPTILSNGTFESGLTTGWQPENSTITVSTTTKHTGNYSLLVSNRASNWGMAKLDITQPLINYGPGRYFFSAFMKMAAGTDNAMVRLCVVSTGSGTQWYYIHNQAAVGTAAWTDIGSTGAGYFHFASEDYSVNNITWSGQLLGATVLINTVNSNNSFYIDDVAIWNEDMEEPPSGEDPTPAPAFFDDFTEGIDPDRWYIGKAQWGGDDVNGGVIPENVSFTNDGILVLKANGDLYEGPVRGINSDLSQRADGKRTGAAIISKSQLGPGSYRVRMKICPRLGACTAIWTYYNDGVNNHEIDIEMPGNTSTMNSTLFSSWLTSTYGRSQQITPQYPNNDGNWHTYRFDWHTEPERVDFYIDDVLQTSFDSHIPTIAGRFWIGVWFPDAWCGTPDFDTASVLVDWVSYTPYDESGWQLLPKGFNQQAELSEYPTVPSDLPVNNYISNANFEANSTAWSSSGSAARIAGVGTSGSYGARIMGNSSQMSQLITAINGNMLYKIQGDMLVQNSGTAILRVECLNSSDAVISGGTFDLSTSSSVYVSCSTQFVTPPGTVKFRIKLLASSVNSVAFFDNLLLSTVN